MKAYLLDEAGGVENLVLADNDPLALDSLQTRAVNVPVRDGKITRAELLLSPEANVNGLAANPQVLCTTDFSATQH